MIYISLQHTRHFSGYFQFLTKSVLAEWDTIEVTCTPKGLPQGDAIPGLRGRSWCSPSRHWRRSKPREFNFTAKSSALPLSFFILPLALASVTHPPPALSLEDGNIFRYALLVHKTVINPVAISTFFLKWSYQRTVSRLPVFDSRWECSSLIDFLFSSSFPIDQLRNFCDSLYYSRLPSLLGFSL